MRPQRASQAASPAGTVAAALPRIAAELARLADLAEAEGDSGSAARLRGAQREIVGKRPGRRRIDDARLVDDLHELMAARPALSRWRAAGLIARRAAPDGNTKALQRRLIKRLCALPDFLGPK
jgi:hypothetical protein